MEFYSKLTGVTYYNEGFNSENRQAIIFQLKNRGLLNPGQELIFQHDKLNCFHSKAIAVFGPDMRQIGFLPRDMGDVVFEFMKLFRVRICVADVTGGYSGAYFGVNVRISVLPAPMQPPSLAHLSSNEDEINYDYMEHYAAMDWNPHDLDYEDYENWLDDLND